MSDMSHLYRAYAAVHNADVNQQLNESRDEISVMDLTQLTKEDLVLVAEDIVEALFLEGVSAGDAFEAVASILEESVDKDSSPLRVAKVTRLAEAFDTTFNKVTERAPEEAELRFVEYRDSKPLVEKWQGKVSHEHGNSKIHEACVALDRKNVLEGFAKMLEGTMDIKGFEIPQKERDAAKERLKQKTLNIRGNNSAEQKARLEKKRGMKLDDHPQFKEENILGVPSKIRTEWAEAYKGIYEKLDPVGQEDADIDNDGDTDSSDKYLAKRRKAIGKAIGKKYVDEAITSEKGKAKAAEMIAKRTTASGRAKSGQGANVAMIKHIGRSNRDGLLGTPPNPKVAGSNWPKSYTGIGGTGNKAARRAAALKKEEVTFSAEEQARIDAIVKSWDEGYQREPDQAGKKDRTHSKQPDPSKPGFTGVGNMSIAQIAKMSKEIEKKQK